RLLPWATVLTIGLVALATDSRAQPDVKDPKTPPPPVAVDKTGALIVPLGGVRLFDPGLKEPPTDIIVSREDILGVRLDPNDPRKLLLTGKSGGLSQLTVVPKGQPALKFDVTVEPDLAQLRNLIRRTVPSANVEVSPGIGNVIILSGYVTSPQDADII